MSITVEELQELVGHAKVVTERGERVGPIGEIYVDDLTGAPDQLFGFFGLLLGGIVASVGGLLGSRSVNSRRPVAARDTRTS